MPDNNHQNPQLSQTAAEQLVQSVVDYAIFMLDTEGTIQSWNPGAERIKGYTAGEIIGEHFSRFYTDEDRAAGVPEAALKQAATEGRFHAEGWRVRKDGRRFWALVVIDPIFDNGKLVGFAKVTRDITHHHEMQRAALESERRFRLLVQGVTDYAIYMIDPEGKITNWNTGAERIKGYGAAEILGKHFSIFYTPEDQEAAVPLRVLETARKEGRYEAEGWRVRKDGAMFWANVIVDAIHDDGGELIGFAKITRDLTERLESQRQLEQSREQLFQSQKMEAIGQLTGGLAHDFNNLLTGISGSLDLLKTRLAQGRTDELSRYITSAQGAAKRAASLTHRLLAFARRQTLDPKPTNANDLITGMEEMIRRTIGPTVEMETALAIGLWTTICDPNQLENAILNLCINAKDAMPDGGRLTIETANKWVDDQIAKERDMRPGQYVQVSVSDTGTGMPPDVVARAFDPFFTTKPTGEGTGLGLSMIYGFVRQSNGQVRIYTEVEKGTTVALYLPRHWLSGKTGEDENIMADDPMPRGLGGTVLVVDDEPLIRMLISEVLEDSGYRIIEAADGASGLKAFRSGEKIDLLVTDVGLPGGMNGRQLADAARELHTGLKILFITGYAENAAVGNGHLAPGMHVLTKPFAMEKLAAKVTDMLKID
ncbi:MULTISPECIES: PAS domain-containing sensor histidine kinase [unclassified Mesorhizobium]|uniref:hybrid sensor histidine kinase/response regulator n=1 Tax=unclassified Mesorhizobium TaxID=325217 RepID=UPI001CCEF8A9|nr:MULTISPECIES: PAS domain-containing sensor histidine kinase [unclassified Mesorhizobium]MBZ9739761.1 PAS domain S-box protein [Mesorhizobium sp. CO1-1-4]MBZ9804975.1 PAS domain S-box protein [Mesorhizobium sp. ES1-6]